MPTLDQVVAVVLAGGAGHRFAPLATDKTLLPILGKPLLQHTLEQLERVGFSQVVVVTNPSNQAWLKQYRGSKLQLDLVPQPSATGMGQALLTAQSVVANKSILVMNAIDQVEDQLFADLESKTDQYQTLLTGKKQPEYFPGGYLQVEENRVISIIEKPPEGEQPSDLINLVFHYFANPSRFFALLHSTKQSDDQYERALDSLLKEETVGFTEYQGYWQPLKFPHMVLDLVEIFLEQRLGQNHSSEPASIHSSAVIEGTVVFGSGVTVEAGAVIKGPCYIGDRVVIGTHSLVRSSCIETDSIVGFGSEVARSYLGPRCLLHQNFVGDSILEGECNPSWGTCFANWRFDGKPVKVSYPEHKQETNRQKLGAIVGKGVFLGVNCNVMPGTTIAPNVIVYPGLRINGAVSNTVKESIF